ncbi:hypothetical protein [Enterococcus sp. AZ109]|uniref:hypothetical protein n=1 Tax=Enterococcus sp. AZ109 TaxID=2774634 RepID=UPI003F219372
MSVFNLFVVVMCGLFGVITTYSGWLFYREREFSYILIGMFTGLVSFVCYIDHFAENEIVVCKGLFLAFWVVSGVFFLVKARISKIKELS